MRNIAINLLIIFVDSLNSTELSDTTYNEIDEFVVTKFNDFLNTPTNTTKHIDSVIMGNQFEIIKSIILLVPLLLLKIIYQFLPLKKSIRNIAKRIIEILDDSNLELKKLKNELKQ